MSALSDLLQRLPRWFWPAVAALGGLVLGLLIGWVWWPVQWTNASLAELSPSAKATYLSAVADAYVSDGDPANAIAMVNERLMALGDDAGQQLLDAIALLQSQPNTSLVRINNLAMMAGELGAPVDAATLAAGAAPPVGPDLAPETAQAAAEAPLDSTAVATSTGGGAIWRWLLGLLGAAALLGGGFWLFRRATQDVDDTGRFSPVPLPAATPGAAPAPGAIPAARPAPPPLTPGGQPNPTSAWSTTVVKPASGATVGPGDDLAFDADDLDDNFGDDDDFDDEGDDDESLNAVDDSRQAMGPSMSAESAEELRSANVTPRYGASGASPASNTSPWSQPAATVPVAAQIAALGATTAAPRPASVPQQATPAPQAPRSNPLSRLATAVTSRTAAGLAAVTAASAASTSAPAPNKAGTPTATATPVATPPAKPAPLPSARPATATSPAASRKLLANHTFQYFAGTPAYIDALNIDDPGSRLMVGDFGMGVSLRNAALHSNPNQVIALEVWLTDNQNPDDYSNQARVLLSDYAAGKDYAQALLKDRDGSVRTMIPRPGARFTLEGRHLLLEAVVDDVQSDDQGIFKAVKVSAAVYTR